MKRPNGKERAALERADTIAEAELMRWAVWDSVSHIDRLRAIGVAGLPRERATDPAASFTEAEREKIRMALAAHIGRMQVIIQCMNGANTTRQGYLH